MTPGQAVQYLETADSTWHPGTVKFDFCGASRGGPYTLVIDEIGLGHTQHPDWVTPAPEGTWRYAERPPAPRPT